MAIEKTTPIKLMTVNIVIAVRILCTKTGLFSGVMACPPRYSEKMMATITVLADMSTAPMAGVKITPADAAIPAASGIATVL